MIKVCKAYPGLCFSTLLTLGNGEAHTETVSIPVSGLDTPATSAAVSHFTLKYTLA